MERQQHKTKQPRPSPRARSTQQVRKPKAAFNLGKPVWNRSLAILGGAWAVVVMIALTAVSGLLSPNLSNGNQSSGVVSVRATTAARATSQSRLPLWFFGAIALSCATGSILVSKQVNRPQRPRKSIKPKRLAPYVVVPEATETAPTASAEPHLAVDLSFALVPRTVQQTPTATPFMPPATLMQLAHQELRTVGQTSTVPTSIPEKEPLDWGEASLADKLDIRKPRSISSLL